MSETKGDGSVSAEWHAGAAAIKYGSLSYDLPFQPNFPAALSLIFGPCVVYSVYFLLKQKA